MFDLLLFCMLRSLLYTFYYFFKHFFKRPVNTRQETACRDQNYYHCRVQNQLAVCSLVILYVLWEHRVSPTKPHQGRTCRSGFVSFDFLSKFVIVP